MNFKRDILFVAPNAGSLLYAGKTTNPGGAERQLVLIANELTKRNIKVSFICKKNEGLKEKRHENFAVYQVSFKYLGGNKFYWFTDGFRLLKTIHKINSEFIILRAGGHLVALLLLVAKKLLNKKLIIWVQNDHDVNPTLKYSKGEKGEGKLIRFLYSFCLKNTDKLICQTENQKKAILKYLKRDAAVIANFAGSLIENNFVPEVENLTLPEDFILWAGNTNKTKRPELMIELAKRMPKTIFVVCIYNNNSLKYKELEKILYQFNNIVFLGNVSPFVMENIFSKAKLLLNTSSHEGFPNAFLQAWSNGVPVISFGIDPDNVIKKFNLGICFNVVKDNLENDLENIALQIMDVLENHYLYNEISKNCNSYVNTYHNPSYLVGQLIKNLDKYE